MTTCDQPTPAGAGHHKDANWLSTMGFVYPLVLPTQNEGARPEAARHAGRKVCKRKYCVCDCPPEVVLERIKCDEVPVQHNHGTNKLAQPNKFRTARCKHHLAGHCCNGALCWMAHTPEATRTVAQNQADNLVTTVAVRAYVENELRQSQETQRNMRSDAVQAQQQRIDQRDIEARPGEQLSEMLECLLKQIDED